LNHSKRTTPNKVIDVYTKVATNYPEYSMKGNYIDSPEYESTGELLLDLKEKVIEGNVDFTSGMKQSRRFEPLLIFVLML
jgi:hypothetical protein